MRQLHFNIALFRFYYDFEMVQLDLTLLAVSISQKERCLFMYYKECNGLNIDILFFHVRLVKN